MEGGSGEVDVEACSLDNTALRLVSGRIIFVMRGAMGAKGLEG